MADDNPGQTPARGRGRRTNRSVPNPSSRPSNIPVARGREGSSSRGRGRGASLHAGSPDPLPETPGDDVFTDTPPTGTGKKRRGRSPQGNRDIEDMYPDVNTTVTRANLKMLLDKDPFNYFVYSGKNFGKPTDNEFVALKDVAEWEMRKHFIAFKSKQLLFAAIKTAIPEINLSSETCMELRVHLNKRWGDWKFDLGSDRLYRHILELLDQIGGQLNHDPDTADGFQAISMVIGPRFDINLYKSLHGQSNCKVLKLDKVFKEENRKRLAFWYLKQEYINLFCKLLPVVRNEKEMNLTTGPGETESVWAPRLPRNTTFVVDAKGRKDFSSFFDSMAAGESFQTVELNQFPWFKYDNLRQKTIASAAAGLAPKLLPSEIADSSMRISTPPPMAGSPFASDFGSGRSNLPLSLSQGSGLGGRTSGRSSRFGRRSGGTASPLANRSGPLDMGDEDTNIDPGLLEDSLRRAEQEEEEERLRQVAEERERQAEEDMRQGEAEERERIRLAEVQRAELERARDIIEGGGGEPLPENRRRSGRNAPRDDSQGGSVSTRRSTRRSSGVSGPQS